MSNTTNRPTMAKLEVLKQWVTEPPSPLIHQQVLMSQSINRNQAKLEIWLTLAPEESHRELKITVYVITSNKCTTIWHSGATDQRMNRRDQSGVEATFRVASALLVSCNREVRKADIEAVSKITPSKFNKFGTAIVSMIMFYGLLAAKNGETA